MATKNDESNGNPAATQSGHTLAPDRWDRHMLYEVRGDRPIPRLWRGRLGTLRRNGQTILNVEEVATRFGGTPQSWRDEWMSIWGECLPASPLPNELKFHIGPWEYTLRIIRDLRDGSGAPFSSLSYADTREIHMSDRVPTTGRLEVLLGALAGTWLFHVPGPQDDDDRHTLNATISAAMYQDLEAAGGSEELELMMTTEPDEAAEERAVA